MARQVDPYVYMMEELIHTDTEGPDIMDVSEDTFIYRAMEYDQNGLTQHLGEINPFGSREKSLREKGERFGEALYNAVDRSTDLDYHEEPFEGSGEMEDERMLIAGDDHLESARPNPAAVTGRAIEILSPEMEKPFYEGAIEAVMQEREDTDFKILDQYDL